MVIDISLSYCVVPEVERLLNKPAGTLGVFYPNIQKRYASDLERQFLVQNRLIVRISVLACIVT